MKPDDVPSDVPIVAPEKLGEAIYQMHNCGLDAKRAYDGQRHTDQGERGKTFVQGLTMRDIMDCFVTGWLHAAGYSALVESGTASYNDIYLTPRQPWDGKEYEIDPLAVGQNMMCEVERRMGIFPNLPERPAPSRAGTPEEEPRA